VFLIGIADHAGPLVMHMTKWRKGNLYSGVDVSIKDVKRPGDAVRVHS
jgi:hypothetical protein